MNTAVRQLFWELADLPQTVREGILAERRVPTAVCSELRSLLDHDSADESLTRRVGAAFNLALRSAVRLSHCGPYRLIRLIGSGGMGDVYLASRDDGEVDQLVAVKLLRAGSDRPAWRERFLRERQVLASLSHPSIARLFDAGHTGDGQPYFVMELVEGLPIDEYASGLDLRRRLELFVQVCAAISHAHSQSVIHRDLKPSNILVDASGTPKILDFGIAKVLAAPADQTHTAERLLTPTYASPEQIRGRAQTIATDVYSLGAVLYKLITGRPARDPSYIASGEDSHEDVTAPSRLNEELPRDLDYIVRKALRFDPAARYSSVQALADDIRLLLDSRPVEARSGDVPYRVQKFVRRHRSAVAFAGLAFAGVCLTATIVRHQQRAAEDRLLHGRRLASMVLAVDEAAGDVHSSSAARFQLMTVSKDYLEGLSSQTHRDRRLSLDLGRAYSLLARAQGISIAAATGQTGKADESLRKAATLVEPVLTGDPSDRDALMTAARINHDRMIVAETEHRKQEALAYAHKAVERLETFLGLGGLSAAQQETASEFLYQIAVTLKNLHRLPEAIQHTRRSVEISRSLPGGDLRAALGLSLLADLYRLMGNPEAALGIIAEARGCLRRAVFPNDTARRSSWVSVLWREAKILGAANGMGLGRSSEAIAVLQEAFGLVEEWTRNDAQAAWGRLFFVSLGRELGELMRDRDPERALAMYDHCLLRLGGLPDNAEARRGEALMLVGSGYALRRLGRREEARNRIEGGLALLRRTGEYEASRAFRNAAVETALRALADHLAETGESWRALEIYEDLARRAEAAYLNAPQDLREGVALSHIHGVLAALYRRNNMPDRAAALSARRFSFWRDWERKLPNSSVVQRQLDSLQAEQRERFAMETSRAHGPVGRIGTL